MKEMKKITEEHKMDILDGGAIVTHQYLINGDDIIFTDIFIEPIGCDYIIKIHTNMFVGTVQEAMEDYHKYMEENFLPEGMAENEFIKYLCREED